MNTLKSIFTKHCGALIALALVALIGFGCACAGPEKDWSKELGGKRLTYANTSGGISDRVDIYFCSSGEFAFRRQFSGFSTGGAGTLSMADEEVEEGRWKIEAGRLVLTPKGGAPQSLQIAAGGGNVVTLDGRSFLVESHGECR